MHNITPDMVEAFKEMLISKDGGDSKFALDILENRNKEDKQTEECWNEIKKLIISNDELFPRSKQQTWVIKSEKGSLTMGSGKSSWSSAGNANKALAHQLGKYFNSSTSYFKMIKNIFGNVKTFRAFLIDNKIIEVVKVDG